MNLENAVAKHAEWKTKFRGAISKQEQMDVSLLVEEIEHRIEVLTGWPASWGETLQVQRYYENGKYLPHHDFFGQILITQMRQKMAASGLLP